MAGSANDGALGHSRPGRSDGLGGGDRARIQGYLSHAVSTHRDFYGAAAAVAGSAKFAKQATQDRRHPGRDGEGGRTDLMPTLAQRAFSEWLGTAFLLAAVVGSGIMAQKLSGGNGALALLCNTLPTGAILTVLILTFGPIPEHTSIRP